MTDEIEQARLVEDVNADDDDDDDEEEVNTDTAVNEGKTKQRFTKPMLLAILQNPDASKDRYSEILENITGTKPNANTMKAYIGAIPNWAAFCAEKDKELKLAGGRCDTESQKYKFNEAQSMLYKEFVGRVRSFKPGITKTFNHEEERLLVSYGLFVLGSGHVPTDPRNKKSKDEKNANQKEKRRREEERRAARQLERQTAGPVIRALAEGTMHSSSLRSTNSIVNVDCDENDDNADNRNVTVVVDVDDSATPILSRPRAMDLAASSDSGDRKRARPIRVDDEVSSMRELVGALAMKTDHQATEAMRQMLHQRHSIDEKLLKFMEQQKAHQDEHSNTTRALHEELVEQRRERKEQQQNTQSLFQATLDLIKQQQDSNTQILLQLAGAVKNGNANGGGTTNNGNVNITQTYSL